MRSVVYMLILTVIQITWAEDDIDIEIRDLWGTVHDKAGRDKHRTRIMCTIFSNSLKNNQCIGGFVKINEFSEN